LWGAPGGLCCELAEFAGRRAGLALAGWALGAARLVMLTVTEPGGRTGACAADRIGRPGRWPPVTVRSSGMAAPVAGHR
jgi:hypothetical protein